MKLHRQIVLLLLAAVLPLVVLLAIVGAAALRQGQDAVQQDAASRVEIVAAALERRLSGDIEVLSALAQSPLWDGPLDQAKLSTFAARVLALHPGWTAVTAIDPAGMRVLGAPELPPDVSPKVVDAQAFQIALRTGRPTIGRVMRVPGIAPGFAIFVPVVRSGQVRFVLSAVVRTDVIQQLLISSRLPEGWRGGVLDASGRVVANTVSPDLVTRPANASAAQAVAGGPSGTYRTTAMDQTPVVAVFRALPGSGWSVHIAMPESVYEAPVRQALWLVIAGALASLTIAALFLWMLARELAIQQRQTVALEETRRLEALGRITGGVAHDFNNLLMIVQGSADLLKRRLKGQERLEAMADAILAATERGQAVTRQLLAFGRKSTHEAVNFRLQARARDLESLLQRSVSSEIAVELEVPPEVWPIHADPNALEVALINLAVNARDAMPDGGRLTVSARNVSLQRGRDEGSGLIGDYVRLSVSDTGTGIASQHLAHIFEPFFTTKPQGKGTGLGLSQVYGFARQSSGAVTVFSAFGEGSTFQLYLPRGGEETARAAEPELVIEPMEQGRILLVEDNRDVAETTASLLASLGYTADWEADPDDALKRLEADGGYDLMISDIMLGAAMSGLELAARVAERRADLPVLLMTGYSEALATGATRGFVVLAKPFSGEELAAAVRRARMQGQRAAVEG